MSNPQEIPFDVIVLWHCRCADCGHWQPAYGRCFIHGFRRYMPPSDYRKWARQFGQDTAGTVNPDQWIWCVGYDGPQISKDVWLWPARVRGAA